MQHPYSDQQLIQGLSSNDSAVIDYLYSQVGPVVKNYIVNHGGSTEDANDLFQEGLVAAYVNIKKQSYTLKSETKFSTYLTQICKYKWYDRLKKGKRSTHIDENYDVPDDTDVIRDIENGEKYSILAELINELGEQCKEILHRYYWLKESMDEIGKALSMVKASVKNGKYRCMQKLKEKATTVNELR